ncbi:hypothetical protein KIN20_034621 [Parelaphostrongylus tenuis]|uniref:Major facilitator superfamily (MFS) profile domain-containing protein n=1 Tax=Parelaphostrongylus tenuis TaxID=148309 RepID=A0AAD5RAN9_PARTN|nr:hypothetical protein KIN20_034621 [Parelaphostrongylus tenuis]
MIVPIYVSEVSPSHIRGRMLTGFELMIILGVVVANVTGGAFSYIDPFNVGWRLMFGCAAIPAVIQFVCFLFLPETPRWLFEHNFKEEAEAVLRKTYNGDNEWVQYEISEICQGHRMEAVVKQQHVGLLPEQLYCNHLFEAGGSILWRILCTPHVRKALFIGSAIQAFQQLSGINTVMYYIGKIIQSSGVNNPHITIWITVGISIVDFMGTLIPMALIERVGRRILLMISVTCVILTLLAMGTAFVLINRDSAVTLRNQSFINQSYPDSIQKLCEQYSLLLYDLTELIIDMQIYDMFSDNHRTEGTFSEWDRNSCKTGLTALPIIIVVLYLLSFSIGKLSHINEVLLF